MHLHRLFWNPTTEVGKQKLSDQRFLPLRRNITSPLSLGLLLAILTLATLSPLLQAEFINLDDQVYVTDNARVKAGLTPSNIEWAFENVDFGFYYPLTWLSHMTDCQLFGLNASGHHLTSILIHVANALLLFLFLLRATGAKWKSWLVSVLFAIHPLHVESVAWISERKDVLSTFFLFLSLLAYLHYSRKPSLSRYILVFLLLLAGLMAKSMLVTAPVVFLLLDFWPLKRSRLPSWWSRSLPQREKIPTNDHLQSIGYSSSSSVPIINLIIEKIPLFLLSFVFSAITFLVQSKQGAVASLNHMSIWTRLGNTFVSYATYLQKMVLPVNLTILYTFPRGGWGSVKIFLSILLLALISILVVRISMRRSPYLLVGWLFYLVVVFPVSGLFQTGEQAYADRYTYVALIGVFLMLVWELASWIGDNKQRRLWTVWSCATLILVLALLSWNQARYWRSSVTTFAHALNVNGPSSKILFSLGFGYIQEGHPAPAEPYLEMGARIYPDDGGMWRLLGWTYFLEGKLSSAEACLRRSIKLVPDEGKSYEALGMVLEKKGRLPEALTSYLKAIVYMKNGVPPRVDAGRIYGRMGLYKKALEQFRNAASIAPADPVPLFYTALALAKLGRTEEAQVALKRSLGMARSSNSIKLCKQIESHITPIPRCKRHKGAGSP